MYPRNAASPEPIAIGQVVQISDGAIQTSGVTVRIKPIGVAEANGAGTTAYSTDGVVLYTPTQAETNYTSFVLIASKAGCFAAAQTVITSASNSAGYAGLDWGKVTDGSASVSLPNTTVGRVTLVDTTTTNSDMRGTDNAALATYWTETRAGFLDGVLLADNYNARIVAVTGSKHVASVVHSIESAAIPEDAFVDGALSNRVLAANAAAEVATAVRTELATELARIDVTSSSRLASLSYTAPDNASIAAVKTVTDKLNSGLVADGAVYQFTANMLELAPAGGGGGGSGDATLANQVLILDQLDVIQNKTDLLNPAPTGSVLLVDSGEYYCTRQDVELVFGLNNVTTWADIDNQGDATFIESRITTMIALAHEQTNDALRQGGYSLPISTPRPASLTYNVAALAGVLLYESRGAIDAENDNGVHRLTPFRNRWEKYIKQLLSQQVRIDAARQNTTTAPQIY